MPEEILFHVCNRIGYVTLNRPQVLNALSYTMIVALKERLQHWANDPAIHAVVVRGTGDKAFCAGGDIRAVYDGLIAGGGDLTRFFAEEYALDYSIHRYPKPYIALMDGIVMGGGMGVAQGARIKIVTDRTRMAMPEVGIGFFPDVGGSYFLSRCPGFLGVYLGVTGAQISGADALYVGLADRLVPNEKMQGLNDALDSLVWTDDHAADIMNALPKAAVAEAANAPLAHLRPAIDAHFGKESVPAIVASLKTENRPEYSDWAHNTLNAMAKRSPLMMCVTFEQLRRGKALDLADCFRMELGMVIECFRNGDFVEGVRALIVDKDMRPQWRPATLEAVDADDINRFFAEHWAKDRHPLAGL